MKLLKKIALIILVALIVIIVVSYLLPGSFRYESTVEIKAPVNIVFDQVNNFKNWKPWDPFNKADTGMENIYTGPESGVGSCREWKSTSQGSGKMKIVESVPDDHIKSELFFGPSKEPDFDNWKFQFKDEITTVTWVIEGDAGWNPMVRYMMFFSGKMMKKTQKQGLEDLKKYCESLPTGPVYTIEQKEMVVQKYATIKTATTLKTIAQDIDSAMRELERYFIEKKIEMTGPPVVFYLTWNPDSICNIEIGFPAGTDIKPQGRIGMFLYQGGTVATTLYTGPYDKMEPAYIALEKWIIDNNKTKNGLVWEEYLTDPAKEPDPARYLTRIYYGLK